MIYDISNLIDCIEASVAGHNLGRPGAYCRWMWQAPGMEDGRDLGLNPYGCADAANILYSIGQFPAAAAERQAWVETLQSMQNPTSGMFHETTHHPIHTTAHCLAALELFEARPLRPLRALAELHGSNELIDFLEHLNWRDNPWNESHRGAGIYAALTLAGEVNLEWQDLYFAWLWEEADPHTGFWRKEHLGLLSHSGTLSVFPHLAGSFHYLFNHEYAHRPLRYPAAMVDTCLALFYEGDFPIGLHISFAEIDWVYCLTRALRQSGHRFKETRQALYEFAARYMEFLLGIDPQRDDAFNDLHLLFGMVCCLAELQQAIPGLLRVQRPLKLVLDRRPFI